MKPTEVRLNHLARKGEQVKVMIIGLGSVGTYLLDYLCGSGDPTIKVVAAGRNREKMEPAVNIVQVGAMIRGQNRTHVTIDAACDLERMETVAACIARHQPDVIVNASRVRSGLKYGSISWHTLRAYGIWTPLSVKYARTIMEAAEQAGSPAVVINTSYSDAVIPWLKGAGLRYPDFGSGNLNHLIPRIQLAVGEMLGMDAPWTLDVTLATGHFHDVVISKEGHGEGVEQLLRVCSHGTPLALDQAEVLRRCQIPMPTDARRNIMNASSNYQIITEILKAIRSRERVKFHSPGVFGELGGYPVVVDARQGDVSAAIDESAFTLESMRERNRQSMALDGIEGVEGDRLIYTDLLLEKVRGAFGVSLPKYVRLADADEVADLLVRDIICRAEK